MRIHKAFLWTMILSLSLAAILGVGALLVGTGSSTMGRILATSLFVGAASITSLMAAIALERRKVVALMWTGIVCSGLALIFFVTFVWAERQMPSDAEELVLRCGGTAAVIAGTLGPFGLLTLARLHRRYARIVQKLTYACLIVLSLLIAVLIWFGEDMHWEAGEIMARAIGVFSILSAAGIVLVPIFWKLQSIKDHQRESLPQHVMMRITCPRCSSDQELKAGGAKCANCGLYITIQVEEPRCDCGYLLYKLQGDRCPECGRAIRQEDRWAAAST